MSPEEKIAKFEEIQEKLWTQARYGNPLQSTYAAALIRLLQIESPEGDQPDDA